MKLNRLNGIFFAMYTILIENSGVMGCSDLLICIPELKFDQYDGSFLSFVAMETQVNYTKPISET
jgi:hypothetical protein